jgi:uncharacterized lipoprotein YmbA
MKQHGTLYSRYPAIIIYLFFVLALSGCITAPDTPAPRFYRLEALDSIQAGASSKLASNVIIGVGPVGIPEYQNRPQIVTQNENKMLTIAQFDRWGEPLDLALARLVSDNLTALLEGATIKTYPWNLAIPVKYQLVLDVVKLESQLDKDLFFTVQWSILDAQANKMIMMKKSEFRLAIDPHNYSGLVKTLSQAATSLSREIAKAFEEL